MVVDFIDAYKARFGVVPICRVLSEQACGIAPSSYYAYRSRPRSARALRDEALLPEIIRVQTEHHGRGRYGARKVWIVLGREGISVARCTVARLMREAGLVGVTRGCHRQTTRRDPVRGAAARPGRPPEPVPRDRHKRGQRRPRGARSAKRQGHQESRRAGPSRAGGGRPRCTETRMISGFRRADDEARTCDPQLGKLNRRQRRVITVGKQCAVLQHVRMPDLALSGTGSIVFPGSFWPGSGHAGPVCAPPTSVHGRARNPSQRVRAYSRIRHRRAVSRAT